MASYLLPPLYSPFSRNFHNLHHPGIFFIFVCCFGDKIRAIFFILAFMGGVIIIFLI
jgi:hypothetical protein